MLKAWQRTKNECEWQQCIRLKLCWYKTLQVRAISQQKVAAREPIAVNCHQSNNQLLTLLHQRHDQCSTATCINYIEHTHKSHSSNATHVAHCCSMWVRHVKLSDEQKHLANSNGVNKTTSLNNRPHHNNIHCTTSLVASGCVFVCIICGIQSDNKITKHDIITASAFNKCLTYNMMSERSWEVIKGRLTSKQQCCQIAKFDSRISHTL